MSPVPPLLDVRNLSKSFPGVRALDGVGVQAAAGEVLAVVGENGAGKSTLMKILAGVYQPDAGEILLDGRAVRFAGVRDALNHGIVLIHQELNLADNLSVAANLFLGRERLRGGPLGWLDRSAMTREATALITRVGLTVPPDRPVGELPIGQQQLVEIARALAQSARIIIMDEPTSSLSQKETETLFGVIADLKRAGVTVLYISHRLAEVQTVADRVTVLRDGRNAGELSRDQISHSAIVRLMVGRDLKQFYSRRHETAGNKPTRLEVRGLQYARGPATPVSFTVRAGEIVGLAGLVGAGRTELAEALFGLRPLVAGEIILNGRPVRIRSPRSAVRHGLLLAPEDRRLHGLILSDSVEHNLSLPNLDMLSVLRLVRRRREATLARGLVERLRVRTPTITKPVGLLSGGNQQKVALGKWLARSPSVLVLDEPTRGVDVGARGEIYALMDQLAADGVAILMISSDLEEVLGMSDRVLVLHQGRLAGELGRAELTEQAVMHLATGGHMKPE
ncbi:MAG TPA: sugar ABC transporter ATP-binding protein [Gemmataceae bacterium]|nr:sugar ABC transporter ATP-binding protein [Gemmataceae bacterium]